jgi:molybdopterin synthase catalytic subunit
MVALIPASCRRKHRSSGLSCRAHRCGKLLAEVATTAAGAQVLFLGTVREDFGRARVEWLEYEAYAKWPNARWLRSWQRLAGTGVCVKSSVEHRVGKLELGDIAVGVAVSRAP